jgi:non-ribosomal peptide synthetase component F
MSSQDHDGTGAGTLVHLLRKAAAERPDAEAFPMFPDAQAGRSGLTFGELHTRARAIAAALQRAKVAPGERALLFYPPGTAIVPALFGCLYAGVVAVVAPAPCGADHGAAELLGALAGCRPAVALTAVATLMPCRAAVAGAGELGEVPWLVSDAISSAGAPAWREVPLGPETAALLHWPGVAAGDGVAVTHAHLLGDAATTDTPASECPPWLPLLREIVLARGGAGGRPGLANAAPAVPVKRKGLTAA